MKLAPPVVVTIPAILLTLVSVSPLDRTVLGTASRFHRPAHWLAFGFLAFLLALLVRSPTQRLFGLAAIVALGAFIECVQYLLYTQPLETWDIRDDICGALFGFVIALAYRWSSRCRSFCLSATRRALSATPPSGPRRNGRSPPP